MIFTQARSCLATTLVAVSILGATPAAAQSEEESIPDGEQARSVEVITVRGQRTLRQLRLRFENKQAEIFAFFNANNSSDRYDILCNTRRITGTHLRRRECEPRFLKDLRVDRTRQYRMGFNTNPGQRELVELAADDYAELQAEMERLIQTHPAFAEDLADMAILQEELESTRAALSTAAEQC